MRSFSRAILSSIVSGLLLFLAFPSVNMYYCAWVALVPLLMILPSVSRRSSLLLGFVCGFVAYCGLLYWLFPMIRFNTQSWVQAAICLFLLSSYLSLFIALWSFLLRLVNPTNSVFRFSLFAASLWVAIEYLRTYFLTGFPWLLLGYSQWKFLSVIQIAEFTGVYGVSFLLVWVNAGLAQFLKTKRLAPFVALLAALLVVIFYGRILSINNSIMSPPYIKVAVIQGNIDQYKKWDKAFEDEIIATYTKLARDVARHNPDVVIWPETAVPGYLPSDPYLFSWVSSLAQETKTYHIIGAPYNNGTNEYYNASLLFGPDGEIIAWHKKTHLVPFGEFVPMRKILEPYFGILNLLADFNRGTVQSPFPIKSMQWGATICSENFFGDIVRKFVVNGADILANQTNDAWYFKTSAPEQHFIMNVFRAVENRRTIVVAGNTGDSGIINPSGVVSQRIPIFTTSYFMSSVAPMKIITFYTRWGDVFSTFCIVVALVLFFASLAKRYTVLGRLFPPRILKTLT